MNSFGVVEVLHFLLGAVAPPEPSGACRRRRPGDAACLSSCWAPCSFVLNAAFLLASSSSGDQFIDSPRSCRRRGSSGASRRPHAIAAPPLDGVDAGAWIHWLISLVHPHVQQLLHVQVIALVSAWSTRCWSAAAAASNSNISASAISRSARHWSMPYIHLRARDPSSFLIWYGSCSTASELITLALHRRLRRMMNAGCINEGMRL